MMNAFAPSRTGFFILFLLAAFLTASCTDQGEGDFSVETVGLELPAEPRAFVPELDGPLRVMSATPFGPMAGMGTYQAITVTFSRPMVALGETPEVPKGVFSIEPERTGRLTWEGTQTLVFHPDEPLPTATAFRVRIASGLTALNGDRLEEAFTWTFETPRPMLVDSDPAPDARFVDPGQSFLLRFNQAIRTNDARSYVRLRTVEDARTAEIQIQGRGDSTLIVRPTRPLQQGTSYELLLLPGLPAAAGRLGMADTTFVRFTTYDRLRLVEVGQPHAPWEEQPETFNPERGVTLTFTTPVRFRDLRNALSFTPALDLPPGIEAQDDVVSATHTLTVRLEPETRYTVAVSSLTDQFGQRLEEASASFRTAAFAPSVRVPEGIAIFEADLQAAVPVRATNPPDLRLGLVRLGPDQIIPVIRTYDRQHYYGDTDYSKLPDPVPAARTVSLGLERNRPGVVALRLDSLLSGGTGLIGYNLVAPGLGHERSDLSFTGLAQVTRLGITAKFSPHQNLIFVTELGTARPVPGASVTIRDLKNRVLWQGVTDEQGRAATPGWSDLGVERTSVWDNPVQFAFVEKDGDVAFTSSVYQDGIEPYRFDIAYDWRPDAVTETGSIFSDRGLYRAGEEVFVKGILRSKTDGDWRPVTDSLRVLIHDPRDQIVFDRYYRPSELGTFDFAWTSPTGATQGVYMVRVVHASDTAAVNREIWEPGDVARGEFRVDAFRTATFAVTASSATDEYVAGDFFEGSISGRYLFGATMGGQPVRYSLMQSPGSFEPEGYPGYRFGSFDDGSRGDVYRMLLEADTVLDAEGITYARIQLEGNQIGMPMRLTWTGVVQDPARQEQGARRLITLHPGQFYVGLKPRTTFIDLNREREMTVDVITVDPSGLPVGDKAVDVELLRQQWLSVRETGSDGRLVWRSERTEELIGSHRIETKARNAMRLKMPVEEGGSYVIRATSRDVRGNTIRTEAFFYATGSGYVAWERTDDDRIDLVPERTNYRPGETARLMVQSPYEEATALITVEREGILSSRVETLRGSAPQITVPLTEAHMPNVFVSVILLNGRTTPPGATTDVGKPGFKIGYASLHVDPGTRRLQVEVIPDKKQYRPGDEVTVDLRIRDAGGNGVPGEIAFSAADAGVLNLIGYAMPDPFDTFYGPRPLGVTTSESRSNLIEQRNYGQKEEDIIGGGGDRSFLLRQDFRPLAHWEPAIRTDRRGRARITFRLPESLTTFRLMATALTADDRFGASRTDVVVTQPLVLQPALPRFVRLDDSFEAGVLVSNLTGEPGEATVTARAEGIRLTGPASRTVSLAAGETREVRFNWAVDNPGASTLRFDATLGNERDAFTVPLEIAVPLARDVSATFAVTDSIAREALSLPPNRVPGLGRFEARLSGTALVGLDGAVRYLFSYPYGCLEQVTSAVRPLLIAGDLLDAFNLDVPGFDRQRAVDEWLGELQDFWTESGFSMWPGSYTPHPYVSAYVVLALAEARAAGYPVPEALVTRAVDRLEELVRRRSDRPEYYDPIAWEDTRVLMLYALARHGRFLDGEIAALAGEVSPGRSPVSVEGVAYLLRTVTLGDRPALRRFREPLVSYLRQQVHVESTSAYLASPGDSHDWVFSSDARATALGLAALVEADPSDDVRQLGARMIRYLMQQRQNGHWASTQENAAIVDAFRAYYRAFERETPAFTAEIRLAGRELLAASFEGRTLRVEGVSRPVETLPQQPDVPIEITKQGAGQAYYSLLLETFSKEPLPAARQGLSIERRIERLDERGNPIGEAVRTGEADVRLNAGDLVRVTLRVSTPTDRNYVVVDDALPAGLEALNTAFETTDRQLVERAREDENYRWSTFNHTEFRDDRVLLFADYLNRGEHTFVYVARATTPGTFVHPPARAEMMYRPETFARTATGTLTVTPVP